MSDDWTASLCDRVNEFLREHPVRSEVSNGAECSEAIRDLHGYTGSLQSQLTTARQQVEELQRDKELALKVTTQATLEHIQATLAQHEKEIRRLNTL